MGLTVYNVLKNSARGRYLCNYNRVKPVTVINRINLATLHLNIHTKFKNKHLQD